MKLIIGLGNPGEKYKNTRHNVGFVIVDKLKAKLNANADWERNDKFKAEICKLSLVDAILAKPQTFMNESGKAVSRFVNFYNFDKEDLWVIHDDLDLKLGEYKIQNGVGPKLHYGVSAIEENLDSKQFWRVRVGVDNRLEGNRIPGEVYVLQNFTEEEIYKISPVIEEICTNLMTDLFNK
jgi:PTH1 family peptidyl-tRNA hydrolase